jgi:hypothetical protein
MDKKEEFSKKFREEFEKLCDKKSNISGFHRCSNFAQFLNDSKKDLKKYYNFDESIIFRACQIENPDVLGKIVTLVCEEKDSYEKIRKDIESCKICNRLRDKIEKSKNEKDFIENVREFIRTFKDTDFLPFGSADGRNEFVLWTNQGIRRSPLDATALKYITAQWNISTGESYSEAAGGYEQYVDDLQSCLLHHLWELMKFYTLDQKEEDLEEGTFLRTVRHRVAKKEIDHIFYDKILICRIYRRRQIEKCEDRIWTERSRT